MSIRDNEDVYDGYIAPLMTLIIAKCKEAGIPVFATFEYAPDEYCTTAVPVDGDSGMVDRLRDTARPRRAVSSMNLTVRDGDGKVTKLITIL